ncbi:hypothetical protein SCLCIDRAFT_1206605 [Scleroderma citrinum Foug A]|uniref:Uncharacterized protein n=1 Tax=Scleroderma citrinum Foug A TaxID=1036808 RepID=A0A0C3A9P3_9AGAM|nr:hypothetical protein SCLCIDRAFT_1206605 [Scleroderma citrinum Foug A]
MIFSVSRDTLGSPKSSTCWSDHERTSWHHRVRRFVCYTKFTDSSLGICDIIEEYMHNAEIGAQVS